MCYGKMSPQNDFQNYGPITGCGRPLFVFNGDFGGFQWGNGPSQAKRRQGSPRFKEDPRVDIQNRAISPLKSPLKTADTQLWVYNSENRFVGSFYHNTCRVKRVKRFFEKSVFWDRLIVMFKSAVH